MKKRFSLSTVGIIVAVSLLAGMHLNELVSADSIYVQISKFKDVLSFTEKFYVEEVDAEKLTEAAISGLLDQLDPHSVYIAPSAFQQVTEDFQGRFEGIGIQFRVLRDTITVIEPIGGGPSAKLGILANDKIIEIDGKNAVGFSEEDVRKHLRGPKGTRVTVVILRAGERSPLVFEITRDEIPLVSVDAAIMATPDVGYVRVNRFNEQTSREMQRALQKLTGEGMKRLVLDLRVNPGGYLEEAVRMADLFLDGGSEDEPRKIVYTKGRRPEFDEEFVARTGEPYERLPVIALIGNASASASEIVAGALQDWDRGLIVGETSFGKGLVQRQWKLNDGSALRLTIARYHTPSGRLIQREYAGKDRSTYHREAFEQEDVEGENINHDRERTALPDSAHPQFRTHAGRVVAGGGGITPDYVVRGDSLSGTTAAIRRRDLFVSFISSYLNGGGARIRKTYGTDFTAFRKSFSVGTDMLDEFKAFVVERGVDVKQEEFERDLRYIRAYLMADIAQSIWGTEARFPFFLEIDSQFQKALALFPEAERIAGLN